MSAGARPPRHVLPPDRLLVGTHWTALEPQPERHFEVRAIARGDDGPRVELYAPLTARSVWIPRDALRDATRWARDWRSLPDDELRHDDALATHGRDEHGD